MQLAPLIVFGFSRGLLRRISDIVAFVFCIACCYQSAFGQTTINGTISASTRWTVANSPYVLNGDVVIQDFAVLTIDPGVTIYMAANASLTVQNASINAIGTVGNPIRVDSEKTRLGQVALEGDWRQWTFLSAPVNSRLEHLTLEHGKGLSIRGANPTLNYVSINNHLGAAITLDLTASPTGVGLQATGNTINGILVPSGDINSNVVWGLRGIPYVLNAGTLSVGISPSIQSITPATVERGQTVTVTLNGTRIGGLPTLTWDGAGVSSTLYPGASDSQINLLVAVANSAPLGAMGFQLLVDAGQIHVLPGIVVTSPAPVVTGVTPDHVDTHSGVIDVAVNGRNFLTTSQVLVNTAPVVTRFVSDSELHFSLPSQTAAATLQIQVQSPDIAHPDLYLTSGSQAFTVLAASPPLIGLEPTPIAIPPDNNLHPITVRLSKPDFRDNRLDFLIADPTKASVSPSFVVIPAGKTTARIYISAPQPATTSLHVSSSNLTAIDAPVFVSGDFSFINTAYALPVGVINGTVDVSSRSTFTVTQGPVGVTVGAVLTGVSPRGMVVGSSAVVAIQGVGIPAGAHLSLEPADGVSVEDSVVNAPGTRLQATLRARADAPVGFRRLLVQGSNGTEIPFVDSALATFEVAQNAPTLSSVDPFVAQPGQILMLTLRGKGLAHGVVSMAPADGVQLDTQSQANADGTSIAVRIAIAPDAPRGARVLRVANAWGESSSMAGPENTLTIVNSVDTAPSSVNAPLVGVQVGDPPVPPPIVVESLQASANVGVLVGPVVTDFNPKVAVVGSDVVLTVSGTGLQGLTASELEPNTDISWTSTPLVNAAGTEVQLTFHVAANAVQGLRGINFRAGDLMLAKLPADLGGMLITAPLPELISVVPQVLLAGDVSTQVNLRGRNFSNVTGVSIIPADGVAISGPVVASADGTQLSFYAQAALGTTPGTRRVVVTTAAGDSTAILLPSNQIQIAAQTGPTYANIMSVPVGVRVGDVPPIPEVTGTYTLVSGLVGVKLGELESPPNPISTAVSGVVGLVVGAGAQAISPWGWLQGSSGTLSILGTGLQAVTSVAVTPDTGILFGSPTVNADATRVNVTIALTADTPALNRRLHLLTPDGEVPFVNDAAAVLGVGQVPTLNSISPVVLQQGQSAVLRVRGTQLATVYGALFEPAGGVSLVGQPVWGHDGFGEFLTFTLLASDEAALGPRVLRLLVPGGTTTSAAQASNTLTIIPAR